jgi:2',3'-cyclic-nucleotide 2'-phosphodiesterase/3'-nucleotidase
MKKTIHIVYTTDTHGRLSSYDFLNNTEGPFGLSRLSSFIKTLNHPFILLDNGDFLQGSPLLDYDRKSHQESVSKVFDALGYQYVTVGNHDFNFGMDLLNQFRQNFQGKILCSNIMKGDYPLYHPYDIIEVDGIKIALVGLTTEFIPVWEKTSHIDGLNFLNAKATLDDLIENEHLKQKSDALVVLYHGGYETNLKTHEDYPNKTIENRGYALFQSDIDVLLTGHQHVPQTHQEGLKVTIQTTHNAYQAGLVTLTFNDHQLIDASVELIELKDYPVDENIEDLLKDLIRKTNRYLDQPVGSLITNLAVKDPLSCRVQKHPLFKLINTIQQSLTQAQISVASLPNETNGFKPEVTLRDIASTFPYENDLVLLEITGKTLRAMVEKNGDYFRVKSNQMVVNPRFLHPKVEHYNYDVYDGIEYDYAVFDDHTKLTKLTYQSIDIQDTDTFTLVLNSYRATGAGGFPMIKDSKVLRRYPISYFDLVSAYLQENPHLIVDEKANFNVKKVTAK